VVVLLAVVHAVAAAVQADDLGVVQEAVEDRPSGGVVAQDLAPVFDRAIGGEHGGADFVAASEDFQDVLGGRAWQAAHAQVLDDQQVDSSQLLDQFLAGAGGGGLGQVF
jgi:hypothetical protein